MKTLNASSPVFGSNYAAVYDILNGPESVADRVEHLCKIIDKHASDATKLLDFGCGSGNYIKYLYDKFSITGVDQSDSMLEIARSRYGSFVTDLVRGDVRTVYLNDSFDIVLMNSAVLCYQLDNTSVLEAMRNVRRHLTDNGLFVFDVWHGPGVLLNGPTRRVKMYNDDVNTVFRETSPELDMLNNICKCVFMWNLNGVEGSETHTVRYFFKPELQIMLNISGFELLSVSKVDSSDTVSDDWHALYVARAK